MSHSHETEHGHRSTRSSAQSMGHRSRLEFFASQCNCAALASGALAPLVLGAQGSHQKIEGLPATVSLQAGSVLPLTQDPSAAVSEKSTPGVPSANANANWSTTLNGAACTLHAVSEGATPSVDAHPMVAMLTCANADRLQVKAVLGQWIPSSFHEAQFVLLSTPD